MTTVVSVEGLSKRYSLQYTRGGGEPTTFREAVTKKVKGWFSPAEDAPKRRGKGSNEFWALKDVGFSVAEGTKLGIIGRNGAGKSTLLKILARITEPTEGIVRLRGRTASLLEVGTGFHPELSGRENIFFNGALLGMSRAETRRKLDQIVEFSGVEQFLDMPVKHYSSGMYVRLAFAVAAHVDPDILILDEVLSVGDLQFQRKCFGRIQELGGTTRAVLFVTHDLSAVSSLCDRCLVLDGGRIIFDGSPSEAILHYHQANPVESGRIDYGSNSRHVGDADARLLAADVSLPDGTSVVQVDIGQPFRVSMRYRLDRELGAPAVPNLHFFRADGIPAFVAVAPGVAPLPVGEYVASVLVPGHFLNEGAYSIGFALTTFAATHHQVHFNEQSALTINVRDPRDDVTTRYGYGGVLAGVVRPRFDWNVERID